MDVSGVNVPSDPIKLSYVYATKDKRTSVEATLPRLIEHRRVSDEIIVVDGDSKDGTGQFLSHLLELGHIDHVVSEPDRSEAHALNKGLLRAKGTFIKLLTDDDLFFFSAIDDCCEYLIENPSVDVVLGSTFDLRFPDVSTLRELESDYRGFLEYVRTGRAFPFCGLSLMIRRTALPRLGLLSTTTCAPDTEYSLRLSRLRAEMAFYTQPIAVRIENPRSNFTPETAWKFATEAERLYLYHGRTTVFEFLRRALFVELKKQVRTSLQNDDAPKVEVPAPSDFSEFLDAVSTHSMLVSRNNVAGRFVRGPGIAR